MPLDLEEISARLEALEAENKALKTRLDSPDFAEGIPLEMRRGDSSIAGVDAARFARRAVVVTAPGLAEDYAAEKGLGEHAVVDSGGLIKNSRSNPLGG
jgi:hypothetical protein